MTPKHALFDATDDRPTLAGAFEAIYQQRAEQATGEQGRIPAAFAASLADGEEFNLAELDGLAEASQELALALSWHCLKRGWPAKNRREASAAFAPLVELHA
jgi:hypothetical protein